MNRRYAQIMIGLFLLFIGLNSVGNGEPFGVLMGLGGFYMLARQFEESRARRQQERRQEQEYARWRQNRERPSYDFEHVNDQSDRRPAANAERVYSHALDAVQAAGQDPATMPVLPVDMGVFSYKGDAEPQVHRHSRVPMDVDYLQPFVQLRLPRRAQGSITLEIVDDQGEALFSRTESHEFNRGRNLIVPTRRLPVHDALDMDEGRWRLRVLADGLLLADHSFGWADNGENFIGEHLQDDGEISNELRAAMAENRLEDMSLDELLSFQEDDEPRQQASSR